MKKLFLTLLCLVFLLGGCGHKKVDYSDLPFANISYSRAGSHDTETIRFASDGTFYYSCSCGSPVNDSDLCEGYAFDRDTQTFALNYIETTEETITEIALVSCEGDTLVLDFDSDIRTFAKA